MAPSSTWHPPTGSTLLFLPFCRQSICFSGEASQWICKGKRDCHCVTPHYCVVSPSLQAPASARAVRDAKILFYLERGQLLRARDSTLPAFPPAQGKSGPTPSPAGRNPRAPAGSWGVLPRGNKGVCFPPCPSSCQVVPEAGISELGDISHRCPHTAWLGRRTRHPQGTWGQTWGQHLQARPEMASRRMSRDRVAMIRAGTGQHGTGEDNQPAVARGWAHRAVGAIGHVTGVEGEDGSPGAHVEDAPVFLQQQGAVVEGVCAEAPDAQQLCKGNGVLRGDPRAGMA